MGEAKLKWSGKSHGGYWGNLTFAVLLRAGMLPAYLLLFFVAAFFVVFRREACRGGMLYLKKRFPNSKFYLFKAYKLVLSFGVCILDKVAFFSGRGKISCEDACEPAIRALLSEGKGLILATAHVGEWQIAGAQVSKYGLPVYAMGTDKEDEKVSKAVERGRTLPKLEIQGDSSDATGVLAAYSTLKKGGIVALHFDRFAGGRSAQVGFLGNSAKVPVAAYVLAAKSGAPILNIVCVRKKLFKYSISSFEPVRIPALCGSELENICAREAQKAMDKLSGILEKYPYQWFNFYDFWGE